MVKKVILIACLVFAALFWFAYYAFYFKWRGCFNEMGRCFDRETGAVYLEQSQFLWLPLAVLPTCISLYLLWRLKP